MRRKSDKALHKAWLIMAGASIALSAYAIYTVRQVQRVASSIQHEFDMRHKRTVPSFPEIQ